MLLEVISWTVICMQWLKLVQVVIEVNTISIIRCIGLLVVYCDNTMTIFVFEK